MDTEGQITQGLLAPSQECLASVKVFPLIPYLKRDMIVSCTVEMRHVRIDPLAVPHAGYCG